MKHPPPLKYQTAEPLPQGVIAAVCCGNCEAELTLVTIGRNIAHNEQSSIFKCDNCGWSWQLRVNLLRCPRDESTHKWRDEQRRLKNRQMVPA